jgi:hypothetical protein
VHWNIREYRRGQRKSCGYYARELAEKLLDSIAFCWLYVIILMPSGIITKKWKWTLRLNTACCWVLGHELTWLLVKTWLCHWLTAGMLTYWQDDCWPSGFLTLYGWMVLWLTERLGDICLDWVTWWRCMADWVALWRCMADWVTLWCCIADWVALWCCMADWVALWRCMVDWVTLWRCMADWVALWRCMADWVALWCCTADWVALTLYDWLVTWHILYSILQMQARLNDTKHA